MTQLEKHTAESVLMGCNVVAKLGLIWKYYFERSALSSVV